MSNNCPVCSKKGKKIIQKVKNNYPVNFYSCKSCELHYSELYNDPKKVLEYSIDTDYFEKIQHLRFFPLI